MRVAIFCQSAAAGRGGMERTASNLVNSLIERGHQVSYVYKLQEGNPTPCYPVVDSANLIAWNKNSEFGDSDCVEQLLDTSPEVAVLLYCNAANTRAPYKILSHCNCPIVLHEGTNPVRISEYWDKRSSKYLNLYERSLYHAGASRIRFTLPSYTQSVADHIRSKVVSFPNAFAKPLSTPTFELKKSIVHINGFKENKNLIPLLYAFSEVLKECPDWRLRLVGQPKNQTQYQRDIYETISRLEIESKVDIVGMVDDINKEFSLSSIHVISSLSEGLPNCVAEAMVNGVASIGFACCPGTNELIKHESNGILVNSIDANDMALSQAIKHLINTPQLLQQYSKQAYHDSSMFSPDAVFDEWESTITAAAKEKMFAKKLRDSFAQEQSEEDLHNIRQLRKRGVLIPLEPSKLKTAVPSEYR